MTRFIDHLYTQLVTTSNTALICTLYSSARVRVTLWLAVYRQSLRLGDKSLETHGQIFFSTEMRLLSLCNILSDKRMGLSFTVAAGPRQHSHSPVQVPRNSWPYFTVSDSRLHQPGGPGPRFYFPTNTVAWDPRYITSERIHRKHSFHRYSSAIPRLLLAYSFPRIPVYRVLPSNDRLHWPHYSVLQASYHNNLVTS
jgi:hypothetical protein